MPKVTLQKIRDLQRELSAIIGVSGHEETVIEYLKAQIEGKVDQLWVDPLGSLLAKIEGSNPDERILLDAHVDEIGFMIRYIDSQGFLSFESIGGWDQRTLIGKSVKVVAADGTYFDGIIGSTPPHLSTEEERKTVVQIKDMYIDIGLSKDEVLKSGINIGSVGTLFDPFVEFPNNLIRGKAFDDRTGCNVLVHLIEEFFQRSPSSSLLFSFSVQEEVGGRGAGPAAYSLDPTVAIAIENTTAADVPGVPDALCPVYINRGPAITVKDRNLIANPKVNNRLIKNAEIEKIPYHIKKPIGGGTDAGKIHITRSGVPSSVVSVPCRYIHSSTSLLSLNDIKDTIRLLSSFIRNPAKINVN